MPQISASLIFFLSAFTLGTLYCPQPLLPIYSDMYKVSLSQTALLTTFALIPLSFFPLIYGIISEYISPIRVLKFSLWGLAFSTLLFACGDNFTYLLLIRLLQGFFIPGILTSTVTYISQTTAAEKIPQYMSLYVIGTIVGGLGGRLLSSFLATYIHINAIYFLLSISLIVMQFFTMRLQQKSTKPTKKIYISDIIKIVFSPIYRETLLTIFCVSFVFACIMNYIPFRLRELNGFSWIHVIYLGYTLGIVTSFLSQRLQKRYNVVNIACCGLAIFLLSLLLLLTTTPVYIFIIIFAFCGAMFFVHSILMGFVNSIGEESKGLVNGAYVAFYYSGAVTGSYFPGIIYEHFGWTSYIWMLFAMLFMASAIFFVVLKAKSKY